MGGGNWTKAAYDCSVSSMGFTSKEDIRSSSVQAFYKSKHIDKALDPKNVLRECRDSNEHPNTIPIILALDVTGSMGQTAKDCASKLDEIMDELYKSVTDVEFLMMGIGDLAFDSAPIQASQFESDIRIFDQTSKIYFESGGGSNKYESYTAAWYFGLYCTDLDCWKRGKKGIIITIGDEMLNPYLPKDELSEVIGTSVGKLGLTDTFELYNEASKKFDIYHIAIINANGFRFLKRNDIHESWTKVIGQHYMEYQSFDLPEAISRIVNDATNNTTGIQVTSDGIRW